MVEFNTASFFSLDLFSKHCSRMLQTKLTHACLSHLPLWEADEKWKRSGGGERPREFVEKCGEAVGVMLLDFENRKFGACHIRQKHKPNRCLGFMNTLTGARRRPRLCYLQGHTDQSQSNLTARDRKFLRAS